MLERETASTMAATDHSTEPAPTRGDRSEGGGHASEEKKVAKRRKHLRVPVSPEEEAAIKQLATNGRSVAATCATSDLDIEWKAFSITGGLKN